MSVVSEDFQEAAGSKRGQQRGGKIPAPIPAKDSEATASPSIPRAAQAASTLSPLLMCLLVLT